jgi:hypothetical protein
MKARKFWFLFASLLSLTFSIAAQGQKGNPKVVDKTEVIKQREFSFAAAAEKLVRAAYAKVTRYNKAFLLVDNRHDPSRPIEEAYLRFELSNFKAGPIQEILNLPHSEVKTITPEEIDLIRVTTTLNDADPHIAYTTNWRTAQYASGYDRKWTINDLLSHDPASYHDIGGYATYDVVLRLHGKVRTYRALTLFHNPYGSVEKLKPSFWDSMVGSAGAMQDLWYERRPAVGVQGGKETEPPAEKSVSSTRSRTSMARYLKSDEGSSSMTRMIAPRVTSETSSNTPSLGPIVQGKTEDRTEHSSGAHGESIDFQGSCEAPSTTQQICRVNFNFVYLYENGTLTNLIYSHKNRYDYILGSHSGSRGTPISCYSAYGVATKNCLGDCTFTATLVGTGLSMQMTGGDVWRGQAVHGHTCNIPRPRPSGGGGGGCNQASVTMVKASDKIPAPNLVNPYCCDPLEQTNCFSGGGEWSDSTCSCYSPIVIDVAGNGFNLTNAVEGVMFDLNGTGTAEQISWTAGDSDDALLVLDRNGNGVIDNGRELFGSSTPQPYLSSGETKNGFRALAVFDVAESGGNGDGLIDARDSIFSSLKLWQDRNHNGTSEAGELLGLANSDVQVIELKYREARRRDDNGNWFRYRAKVNDIQGGEVGRWAWDVFLQKQH